MTTIMMRAFTGLLLLAAAATACADERATARTDNVVASLLAEHLSVTPGNNTALLLKLDIRDGWHTYWRNPGDSGEATRIDWTLPDGVSVAAMEWPAPQAIPFGGFINFGFEGTPRHVIPVQVADSVALGQTLELTARAHWLVCDEICIPESATLIATLAVGPTRLNSDSASDFAAARDAQPVSGPALPATFRDGHFLLDLSSLNDVQDPYFFPGEWGMTEPSSPQTFAASDRTLTLLPGASTNASSFEGVLLDRANGNAWQVTVPRTAGTGPTTSSNAMTVWTALAFALLGGMILNLMPCVFPVLSMKALHLVGGGMNAEDRRREGLAYTAGVLAFFALLGVVLLVLRQGGQAVGWGFQLQSAPVVGVLALLMFAIGLNLLGVFDVGGRLLGVGSGLAARGGWWGAFFTGALAAVVATPCTAPFMGAALGFALTQAPAVSLLIMLSLGVGLALPFLMLALVPGFARFLPRPGRWMESFRQLLAFPMFGAAVWLAWVLTLQTGPDGVLRLLVAALLLAFAVWLGRRVQHRAATLAAVVVGVGALALVAFPSSSAPAQLVDQKQAFSAERVARERAAGRTVFVNQTAAWCLTCLVNEKNVLSSTTVQQAFAEQDVAYLAGDWTQRDPAITAFLAEHGRSGVPLYVVYHGNGPAQVLPPLLTESIVLEALARSD